MHKQLFTLLVGLAALVGLPACNTDHDSEVHLLHLLPAQGQALNWYADQTADTLAVQSTDSWTLRLDFRDPLDSTHLHVSPNAATLPAGNATAANPRLLTTPLHFRLTPNTSTKALEATLTIQPATGKIGALRLPLRQAPYLHIAQPAPTYDAASKQVVFKTELLPDEKYANLHFRLYDGENDTHALTSDADWLSIPAEHAHPAKGAHLLRLKVEPNPTENDRTAHLTLTSNPVSTVITFTQRGTKKK